MEQLLQKYNKNIPRYTSYPPVPQWDKSLFSEIQLAEVLEKQLQVPTETSLYVHLPYCENLCTYCGCHKHITTNHSVEMPYLDALLREWSFWKKRMHPTSPITSIHLGGGTPTFFSADHLYKLLSSLQDSNTADRPEISVEVHPNHTQKDQLVAMKKAGLTRISIGIQDFDPIVQTAINRPQSYATTKQSFDWARELSLDSLNADLVYGLPFQTLSSLEKTLKLTLSLKPDRIAYYAYAHVPWKSKSQRHYDEYDLPDVQSRMKMSEMIHLFFTQNGYKKIGMDHYALPTDPLLKALENKTISRNFMGYTDRLTPHLIGLGASSISKIQHVFLQNNKDITSYKQGVQAFGRSWENWHCSSVSQERIQQFIHQVMCLGESDVSLIKPFNDDQINYLKQLLDDGLVLLNQDQLKVTPLGESFLRQIAWLADEKMGQERESVYSKGI